MLLTWHLHCILITQTKASGPLITGAIIAGILGVLLITAIIRKTFLKEDTALGIILSVFFGFGTLLLTMIQTIPTARQAGLDTYLFGNAATMLKHDVFIIGGPKHPNNHSGTDLLEKSLKSSFLIQIMRQPKAYLW